jgi:hypothetical protein
MPRYGPPPSAEPPPPPPDDDTSGLTRWSWRAKVLAVVATFGMVVAFVFEFLPPTSPKSSQKISTTVVVTSTTLQSSTTLPPTTTLAPTTSVPATTTTR